MSKELEQQLLQQPMGAGMISIENVDGEESKMGFLNTNLLDSLKMPSVGKNKPTAVEKPKGNVVREKERYTIMVTPINMRFMPPPDFPVRFQLKLQFEKTDPPFLSKKYDVKPSDEYTQRLVFSGEKFQVVQKFVKKTT